MTLSASAKVALAFLVGLLALVAKSFFGVDDLQPDLMAVAAITPVVSLLSLFGPLKGSAIGKAAIAIVFGVVWAVVACHAPMSKILCGINGVANGLMACGLWSAAKAGAESAKKAVAGPGPSNASTL